MIIFHDHKSSLKTRIEKTISIRYFISGLNKIKQGKEMVCASTLLKDLLSVKHCVIETCNLVTDNNGVKTLQVHLHPLKSHSDRCPVCGKRCPVYDRGPNYRKWRDLDSSNGLIVELYSKTQRISCKEHGIKTASVPWAFKDSGFTTTFDLMATFLAMNINKSVAAQYLRCDWHTIMRCISRVREFLEPDLKKRYEGLVNIGIDETSYRKGHTYVTVVVNHDTNTVVWCSPGHSTETLSQFFEELTHEQKDSIKCVSGDGAKWIYDCMEKYIPNATRCVDPFHVVSWAMESLDSLRKDIRREHRDEARDFAKEHPREKGRPKADDKDSAKLNKLNGKASNIKSSTYALGKAPENLTQNQMDRLEYIANTSPKLFRGYTIKERLRLALKSPDSEIAKAELDSFFWRATHSRIEVFKELGHKIRRHEEHILNTIESKLSSARVESINNKIKLFIRKAYGFRNIQNMLDMIMLGCSNIFIPLPNRGDTGQKVA